MLKSLAALGAALFVLAGPALAEPPPKGYYGNFALPMISCTEREQLVEIFKAGEHDPEDGAKAQFDEYRRQGVCVVANPGPVAVGEVESLGTFYHSKGKQFLAWALHVGNAQKHWWVMYLELSDNPLPGEHS